jgi:hypothetical protein
MGWNGSRVLDYLVQDPSTNTENKTENQLYFYALATNNPKIKLRKNLNL